MTSCGLTSMIIWKLLIGLEPELLFSEQSIQHLRTHTTKCAGEEPQPPESIHCQPAQHSQHCSSSLLVTSTVREGTEFPNWWLIYTQWSTRDRAPKFPRKPNAQTARVPCPCWILHWILRVQDHSRTWSLLQNGKTWQDVGRHPKSDWRHDCI